VQLGPAPRTSRLRTRLGAAACLLLASGTAARAQTAADSTANRLEASALIYGERQRTNVVEPSATITHLFGNGQALSAGLGLDVMTGASPTGARASSQVQTTTSASGQTSTTTSSALPTAHFSDIRGVLDLGWLSPLGRLARSEAGGHASREKDYQSLGVSERLSLDLLQRLVTISAGGSIDHDSVFPVGGTPLGLSPTRVVTSLEPQGKRVTTGTVGISRILTRRWMMSLDASRTVERGYLTEPYKIVSIVSPDSDVAVGSVSERRPENRDRRSLLASSVYHFASDVLYLSYRYYWDDWGLRSHTLDGRYRVDLPNQAFVQPHLRLYTQRAANFFTFGLPEGEPLPGFASSDQRLGPMNGVTLGATYGFRIPGHRGDFTVRAEWIHQWGPGRTHARSGGAGEDDSVQAQQAADLFPPLDIGTVVAGYTVGF
jgi:hypothetical protein